MPLNNHPFYEKLSYLICITNRGFMIGQAQILLQALPYSNSPLPPLLLSSSPWNPPFLLLPNFLQSPSFFQNADRSHPPCGFIPLPTMHWVLPLALDVAGSICVGGFSPLPSQLQTDLLLPLTPTAAAASGRGHHGNSSRPDPTSSSSLIHTISLPPSLSYRRLYPSYSPSPF